MPSPQKLSRGAVKKGALKAGARNERDTSQGRLRSSCTVVPDEPNCNTQDGNDSPTSQMGSSSGQSEDDNDTPASPVELSPGQSEDDNDIPASPVELSPGQSEDDNDIPASPVELSPGQSEDDNDSPASPVELSPGQSEDDNDSNDTPSSAMEQFSSGADPKAGGTPVAALVPPLVQANESSSEETKLESQAKPPSNIILTMKSLSPYPITGLPRIRLQPDAIIKVEPLDSGIPPSSVTDLASVSRENVRPKPKPRVSLLRHPISAKDGDKPHMVMLSVDSSSSSADAKRELKIMSQVAEVLPERGSVEVMVFDMYNASPAADTTAVVTSAAAGDATDDVTSVCLLLCHSQLLHLCYFFTEFSWVIYLKLFFFQRKHKTLHTECEFIFARNHSRFLLCLRISSFIECKLS